MSHAEFHRARQVLTDSAFLRERNDVFRIEKISGVPFSRGLDALEFRYRELGGEAGSILLIVDASCLRPVDTTLFGPGHREWMQKKQVYAVCETADCEARIRSLGIDATILSPGELFRRLVPIPDSLASSLMEHANGDFEMRRFSKTYHSRTATVLSAPAGFSSLADERLSLDEFFMDWSRSAAGPPLLILGDRGSGKSWEVLHIAACQAERHRNAPWQYAPPLYLPLSRLRSYFDPPGRNIPTIASLLLETYREIQPAYGDETFNRFFDAGHVLACLDGVDEIVLTPTDEQAHNVFTRLLSEVAPSAKLVLTARENHFRSRQSLLETQIFGAGTVADQFLVLELDDFSASAVQDVAQRTARAIFRRGDDFEVGFEFRTHTRSSEWGAVARDTVVDALLVHPAVLSEIVRETCKISGDGAQEWAHVVLNILNSVTLRFNLSEGKTVDVFDVDGGDLIQLEVLDRLLLLEEFAQMLALRGLNRLSPDLLLSRLEVLMDAKSTDLLREFRAQTLLELGSDNGDNGELQFCYSLPVGLPAGDAGAGVEDHERSRFGTAQARLFTEAERKAPVGVSSVAGALCLANWARRRLDLPGIAGAEREGDLEGLEEHMSVIGLAPLGPIAGAILESLLRHQYGAAYPEAVLGGLRSAAVSLLRGLAQRRDLRIFSPRLRYLGHNLEATGIIDEAERARLEPWSREIVEFISPNDSFLPQNILVPPVGDRRLVDRLLEGKIQSDEINSSANALARPYLLSVSEVTNGQYLEFLRSDAGAEWRVERVTRAGGGGDNASGTSSQTNEYHLYHWSEQNGEYLPPVGRWDHPVTYISWFAAKAYCDWLSDVDAKQCRARKGDASEPGYRLPTAAEWLWVAQGGYTDVEFPWDVYGRALNASRLGGDTKSEVSESLLRAMGMDEQRDRIERKILTEDKDTRPVGTEIISSFGVFGIVGNVKEWVYDRLSEKDVNPRQNLILGGSSNLGRRSFSFSYYSGLFPQNTNPDVGFRVCRHLSDREVMVLRNNEESITSLELR